MTKRAIGWILLMTAQLVLGAPATSASIAESYWYDWGLYGVYPQRNYESFSGSSPWPNILKSDRRCAAGYTFIEPRGLAVGTPGPIMLDQNGNLVWMQTEWGQAMDVKVQSYKGDDYITFWHGSDNGTFGQGHYLMLNSSYDVFKKITPAGNFSGDLHELLITSDGTAMMSIYETRAHDLTHYGISDGWIVDSLFQEIDLETGQLVFQWRASDHFPIAESQAPIGSFGRSSATAFDFFHINSISKDADRNYIVSSRYMCAAICIDHTTGAILWQLGGQNNSFTDLSDGGATNFTWQHHVTWHKGNRLTIFDNGAYNNRKTAEYSRGLLVELDWPNRTARLVQDYVAPQRLTAGSQGSVQLQPGGKTVLVGWGHSPAYTEYDTATGNVLCDVHIGAVRLHMLGWCKNYRTFKYPWVGKPSSPPDIVMRPKEKAVYVSWNGATEVTRWILQSSNNAEDYEDHGSVSKESFETKLLLPGNAKNYIRVGGLDKNGTVLAYSAAVSKLTATDAEIMAAPPQRTLRVCFIAVATGCISALLLVAAAIYFRGFLWSTASRLANRLPSFKQHKYSALPTDRDNMVQQAYGI